MALPTSGTISMSAIRTELGIPSQAPFSLLTARNGGYVPLNPYSPTLPTSSPVVSLSAWYGYCHTCTTLYSFTIYTSANHPGSYGWDTAAEACNGTRSYPLTVYSSSSSITVGSTLYLLSGGVYYPLQVNLFVGQTQLWIFDGTGSKPIRLTSDTSNVIAETGTCIACKEYYNPQSYTVVCYPNDCNGNAMGAVYVDPNQSICAQEGTAGFELIDIGFC